MDEYVELWFCVDQNGNEWASNWKPKRIHSYIKETCKENFITKFPIEKYHPVDDWFSYVTDDDYEPYGRFEFDATELPAGTIKLLLGVKMDWHDEPMKFPNKPIAK